jgi:hypothetical protein
MPEDEDYIRNWYVLIFGLDCENSPQVIAPGLSIRRLNHEITIFDLAAAGAQGFQQWSMLAPLSPACKCEIESAKDADIRPKAVHGDDLSEEQLYEGMGNSFELLRDLLLRVVERGAELSEDDLDHIIFH